MSDSTKTAPSRSPQEERIWAIQELVRIAEFERRAGVDHWHDASLADSMRDLVREAAGMVPEPQSAGRAASVVKQALKQASANRPAITPGSAETGPRKKPARRTWGPPPAAEGRSADWEAELRMVGEEAAGCRQCELCQSRKNVVFGVGHATVPLVFVGEAPGAEEDRQGIPFVGRAGQLLTKIIAAIGLSRDDVYICNVLKCRPPGNRNPAPEEIQSCTPYLDRQLQILRPKAICTLGLFASQYLLETTQSMGRLRGRVHAYKDVPVVPTYHPAALLRNPDLKAMVWEDVQVLRETLDA